MRGTAHLGVINWLQFRDPVVEGRTWNVNLTFLLSNWNCLYGKGCPGHFGIQDSHVIPDVACCSHGFYVRDEDDFKEREKLIALLGPEDWDSKLRAHAEKKGWWRNAEKDPDGQGENEKKSRVFEGGCIFSNRSNGDASRPGCAFLALADRLGNTIEDHDEGGHNTHTSFMPTVCHQVPLKFRWIWDENDDNECVVSIDAWDATEWTEDLSQDNEDWMHYWCVDTPDAYTGSTPVYVTMEDTMREEMGDPAYDRMVELIKEQQPKVSKMPGATINDGRPLLPLLVGNRTPRRPDPAFQEAIKEIANRDSAGAGEH